MTNSKGKRRKTRQLLKQKIPITNNYQNNFLIKSLKKNDKINVILSSSTKKGIPSKFYFGKTGTFLTNLNKVSCILIKKSIDNRIINKKLFLNKKHFIIDKNINCENVSELLFKRDKLILKSNFI
mmetsp:Transcript_26838/g.37454  ORF Transcript_26838/g.37454 Transcript_26838/m.37454 type:complete len:125 (+) Transcript_26838:630-1004(+)